jgi:predicted transglutaminase-like protease
MQSFANKPIMLSVAMLSVAMLSVSMLSVAMLSVAMLSVAMLSVAMLSVAMLSVAMLSVAMLSVAMLSVIMMNVEASFQITPTLYILDTKTKPGESYHFTQLIVVVQNVKFEQGDQIIQKRLPNFSYSSQNSLKSKKAKKPKSLHQSSI